MLVVPVVQDLLACFKNAVFHQIFERGHLDRSFKTAAAFAFADGDAVGNII